MEEIQKLKIEAYERKIESLEWRIRRDELAKKTLTDFLLKVKDKDDKDELQEQISYETTSIEETKKELEELKKITPEQYVENCVSETIDSCNSCIKRTTDYLSRSEPDSEDIEWAVDLVREEIIGLIYDKKIKAPKSEKKQEAFIEELLKTPEYQAMIKEKAQQKFIKTRGYFEEDLARSKKILASASADSKEYVQKLIESSKEDCANAKEIFCGLDVVAMFEMPERRNKALSAVSKVHPLEYGGVREVLAQIPPEEYMKVRHMIEKEVDKVLSTFDRKSKELLAKEIGCSVAGLAAYFGAAFVGAGAGVLGAWVGIDLNSLPLGIAGGTLGFLGGIGGTHWLSARMFKLGEKNDLARQEHSIDDAVEKAIQEVLKKAGYIKGMEGSSEQLGQS